MNTHEDYVDSKHIGDGVYAFITRRNYLTTSWFSNGVSGTHKYRVFIKNYDIDIPVGAIFELRTTENLFEAYVFFYALCK